MTYKSIDDAIKAAEGSSLFRLTPLVGSGIRRHVLVSKDVYSIVEPPWPRGDQGSRYALARQILDSFILGDFLTIAEKPFDKSPTAILARVNPVEKEVWDFRCLDPEPGIRIFGSFGAYNIFIALMWDFRENLNNGGFSKAVRDCSLAWSGLFGGLSPYTGSCLGDYVSRPFRTV